MSGPDPLCSVIVPTRNRPEPLGRCLEGLARVDQAAGRLEVVVVDDGGAAALAPVVDRFRSRLDITLHRQAWAGPAAARNAGAGRARGDLLVFTDDDCTPRPDWLRRLVARQGGRPDQAVGGRTLNALADNPYSSAAQMVIDAGYVQRNYQGSPMPFFTTNNLAVPAAGFRELGGFDPAFTTAEDRDFCARWAARGWPIAYEPEAVVEHRHPLTLGGFCRLHFAYGTGAFRFHRKLARAGRPVAIEPSFYLLRLPRQALAAGRRGRAAVLLALLVPWFLTTTAGFAWQALADAAGRGGRRSGRGLPAPARARRK